MYQHFYFIQIHCNYIYLYDTIVFITPTPSHCLLNEQSHIVLFSLLYLYVYPYLFQWNVLEYGLETVLICPYLALSSLRFMFLNSAINKKTPNTNIIRYNLAITFWVGSPLPNRVWGQGTERLKAAAQLNESLILHHWTGSLTPTHTHYALI